MVEASAALVGGLEANGQVGADRVGRDASVEENMSRVRKSAKKLPLTPEQKVWRLRKELKAKSLEVHIKIGEAQYWKEKVNEATAKLTASEDRLLPQKQALLKELSFLVNATSRAVRTTMWSLVPEKRRGW